MFFFSLEKIASIRIYLVINCAQHIFLNDIIKHFMWLSPEYRKKWSMHTSPFYGGFFFVQPIFYRAPADVSNFPGSIQKIFASGKNILYRLFFLAQVMHASTPHIFKLNTAPNNYLGNLVQSNKSPVLRTTVMNVTGEIEKKILDKKNYFFPY